MEDEKVIISKTKFDAMEEDIKRLKGVNKELVKGANVVIDPVISLGYPSRYDKLRKGREFYQGIAVIPDKDLGKNMIKIHEDLEGKLKERFDTRIGIERDSINRERTRLEEEYDQKLALLEKQKQGYEARPIKRYVLAGVILATAAHYLLGIL